MKSVFKRLSSLLMAIAMIVSLTALTIPASAASEFTDVPKSFWGHDDIMTAVDMGLFNGVGNNMFKPNAPMTRGMLTAVLYRYAGEPECKGLSTFRDIDPDDYYFDAVAWAQHNKILPTWVTASNTFKANEEVERGEFATMLWYFSLSMGDTYYEPVYTLSLGDVVLVREAEYSTAINCWAYPLGIMTGVSKYNMAASSGITRAQAAAMLCRYERNVMPRVKDLSKDNIQEFKFPGTFAHAPYYLNAELDKATIGVGETAVITVTMTPYSTFCNLDLNARTSNQDASVRVQKVSSRVCKIIVRGENPGTCVVEIDDSAMGAGYGFGIKAVITVEPWVLAPWVPDMD